MARDSEKKKAYDRAYQKSNYESVKKKKDKKAKHAAAQRRYIDRKNAEKQAAAMNDSNQQPRTSETPVAPSATPSRRPSASRHSSTPGGNMSPGDFVTTLDGSAMDGVRPSPFRQIGHGQSLNTTTELQMLEKRLASNEKAKTNNLQMMQGVFATMATSMACAVQEANRENDEQSAGFARLLQQNGFSRSLRGLVIEEEETTEEEMAEEEMAEEETIDPPPSPEIPPPATPPRETSFTSASTPRASGSCRRKKSAPRLPGSPDAASQASAGFNLGTQSRATTTSDSSTSTGFFQGQPQGTSVSWNTDRVDQGTKFADDANASSMKSKFAPTAVLRPENSQSGDAAKTSSTKNLFGLKVAPSETSQEDSQHGKAVAFASSSKMSDGLKAARPETSQGNSHLGQGGAFASSSTVSFGTQPAPHAARDNSQLGKVGTASASKGFKFGSSKSTAVPLGEKSGASTFAGLKMAPSKDGGVTSKEEKPPSRDDRKRPAMDDVSPMKVGIFGKPAATMKAPPGVPDFAKCGPKTQVKTSTGKRRRVVKPTEDASAAPVFLPPAPAFNFQEEYARLDKEYKVEAAAKRQQQQQ